MPINIKNKDEQEKMRVAGQLASEVLTMISNHIRPGVSTKELDEICNDFIVNNKKLYLQMLVTEDFQQQFAHL